MKKKLTKKKKLGAVVIKHKKVLEKMSENIRNGKGGSIVQARIDAGYSKSYASSGHITETKAWDDLMTEQLSDSLLLEKHKALLEKQEVITRRDPESGEVETIRTGEIDAQAVKAGLDMAYKLKKRYDNTIKIKGSLSQLSRDEIEDAIAGEVSEAIAALAGEGEA